MKYLIDLFLAFAFNVHAFDPEKDKIAIIDRWQCGEMICGIVAHEDGRILFLIADTKGIKTAVHRGVIVYERDQV